MQDRYSLAELADATGIEERTIRSYIERGLLAGAQTRGRGASYSREHLSRLLVVKSLRRARPNIGLSEIRIFLQGLSPDQIDGLASGSISAEPRAIAPIATGEPESQDDEPHETHDTDEVDTANLEQSATKLTGVERLLCLLRRVSGSMSIAPSSRVERWQRIAITPDIELSIRAEFDSAALAAFSEVAGLLRNLLERTETFSEKSDE
jgi:DNA-binding transcriptional MerR regulator